MKKHIIVAAITASLLSCNTMTKNENPLLGDFTALHQTVPFDKIENEHYIPAFEVALAEAKAEINEIVSSTEEPTFENTIIALERAGERLNLISTIFFNLNSAHTNDTLQNIALEISPKLTEFSNFITLNNELFQKIKVVYENVDSSNLTKEQEILLDDNYKSFSRKGAALEDDKKAEYSKIATEMSTLSLEFQQNVLAATNEFELHLTTEDEVKGLPNFVKEMGASEAKSRSKEGYVFTLHAPSMVPFMQYSERRDLREKLWRAYNSRCFKTEKYNNENIVKRIVELRLKRAQLLGYATHADYALEDRMASNSAAVNEFLAELLDKSLPFAKSDVKMVNEYAKKNGADFEVMPWDFGYYSDKLKNEKYALNDELLKPYFELTAVRNGVFALATELYGIKFVKNDDIVPYQEDVECFEVFDEDGSFLSVLYLDFFPRSSKSGGAWMTSYREQYVKDGVNVRPHVSLVCNFTKPTEETPSLLTFSELTTFLHEFGHGLHGMLANGTYVSTSGTNVAQDFVELPSQILENWATEKEFLAMFAKHYQTGEVIPDELVEKIIASKNYLSGYASVRQLTFGISDMAWHSITEPVEVTVQEFEKNATVKVVVLPSVDDVCMSPSFSHIFAGGYSAGYYSYKWAEVLDADAFSLFKEKGIFNKEVAKSFRENILSKGSSEDEMELFIKFRGRKPEIDALLNRLVSE
ncbi:MAG: M3 family metallopeptidase [Rikenellaceae bacterium]